MNEFAPPAMTAPAEPEATKTRWKPIAVVIAVLALAAGGAWLIGERQADDRQEDMNRIIQDFGS